MSRENNKLPRLRFPEFQDAGEWEEKRLGEVADVNPKASTLPKDFVYIDLESVVSGSLIKENNIKKAGAPSRAQRLLKNEDVLFQMVRPYQKNNYYFDKDGDYVASTGYAQLRAKGAAKFLFQTLHTTSFVNKVLARCTGTSYPAINSSDLVSIHVFTPTLPEQRKIADCLSSLDDLITAQTQKLAHLKTHKKGLMQQLFPAEGETQPKLRFPEFRDAGDWEEKRLGEVADVNPKASTLPKDFVYIDLESVVSGSLIKENNIKKSGAPSRAQRLLKNEDVLFQMVRPYQKNNYYFDKDGDYVASTGYAQLRAKGAAKFLFQTLHTTSFVNKVLARCTGTSYPAINSSDLVSIHVFTPTLPEQQKIAACLSSLDELITAQTQKLTHLKTHKKGLMQQLFPATDEVNG